MSLLPCFSSLSCCLVVSYSDSVICHCYQHTHFSLNWTGFPCHPPGHLSTYQQFHPLTRHCIWRSVHELALDSYFRPSDSRGAHSIGRLLLRKLGELTCSLTNCLSSYSKILTYKISCLNLENSWNFNSESGISMIDWNVCCWNMVLSTSLLRSFSKFYIFSQVNLTDLRGDH